MRLNRDLVSKEDTACMLLETDKCTKRTKTYPKEKLVKQKIISEKKAKTSLLIKECPSKPIEWKTYIKVGQMNSNPRNIIPFVIEWVPNLFPRTGIGELTIKFEFGHQKNGEVDSFHEGS